MLVLDKCIARKVHLEIPGGLLFWSDFMVDPWQFFS